MIMFKSIKESKKPEVRICLKCGADIVKHIVEEGSRTHVIRYDNFGSHCNVKNCEVNHHNCGR